MRRKQCPKGMVMDKGKGICVHALSGGNLGGRDDCCTEVEQQQDDCTGQHDYNISNSCCSCSNVPATEWYDTEYILFEAGSDECNSGQYGFNADGSCFGWETIISGMPGYWICHFTCWSDLAACCAGAVHDWGAYGGHGRTGYYGGHRRGGRIRRRRRI